MDNNQIESTNNSALGEISVLTPSQKRALEKAEEDKKQKASAKKRKREEAQQETKKKDLWRYRGLLCLSLLFTILFCWILSDESNGTFAKIIAAFGILFFGIGAVVIMKAIIEMKK